MPVHNWISHLNLETKLCKSAKQLEGSSKQGWVPKASGYNAQLHPDKSANGIEGLNLTADAGPDQLTFQEEYLLIGLFSSKIGKRTSMVMMLGNKDRAKGYCRSKHQCPIETLISRGSCSCWFLPARLKCWGYFKDKATEEQKERYYEKKH